MGKNIINIDVGNLGLQLELLYIYKYGITYDIANKVVKYINKAKSSMPTTINIPMQEEILSYAYFNEYGWPQEDCGFLPNNQEFN